MVQQRSIMSLQRHTVSSGTKEQAESYIHFLEKNKRGELSRGEGMLGVQRKKT